MGKYLRPSKAVGRHPYATCPPVLAALLMSFICFSAPRAAMAENFDAGVENEAVMANSEGAIAEAEEARKRESAEKARNSREQKSAQREADRAKKVEADAKVTMAKAMVEESKLRKEREAAEARRHAASDKIKEIQMELQARQTQLNVLRELSDNTVADRDRLEQQVRVNNDRLRMIDVQIAAEKRRKSDSEAALNKSKEKLAKSNRRVQEANARLSDAQRSREPSSVGH